MNSYKISIITICRNVAKDLERTIKSVQYQTYKDYEYIIVDGNSSDNTVDIINPHKLALTEAGKNTIVMSIEDYIANEIQNYI